MNNFQLAVFGIYCFSVWISGISIYAFINRDDEAFLNRSVYLGETFLLGSILVIGELLCLSLVGLYSGLYLWGCIGLNYLFLLKKETREAIGWYFRKANMCNVSIMIFFSLLGFFVFRNYYFLVAGDSHNIYLLVQKLWLMNGTSIIGDEGFNIGFFTPQFNSVPYALGISIFGQEVLFPQLINISWRIVVLLLVFGYTAYRFNGYFGLVASALVLFDEHFFYSGVNSCVIINGAVIAFLFASVYNFWESKKQDSSFRFLLALIFLSQLMANKYQMAYATAFIAIIGLLIQPSIIQKMKIFIRNKRFVIVFVAAIFITLLWYIKNFLVTGCPTFPVFAEKFGIFNWTPEMTRNFSKVFGKVSFGQFFKYLNYLYTWPGVVPLKALTLIMSGLPFIFLLAALRSRIEKDSVEELSYWLGVSLLAIAGFCFVTFHDPRIYRYALPVYSFAVVYAIFYVMKYCIGIKREAVLGVESVIAFLLIFGFTVMTKKTIPCNVATVKDNIGVLLNQIHMKDAVAKYYPQSILALQEYNKNMEKSLQSAWDAGAGGANPLSAFLLPNRPRVGLWCTTLIKWDSYEHEALIIRDLNNAGIKWVMTVEDSTLKYLTLNEFAQRMVQVNRYPEENFYNYGFPRELAEIRW